MRLSDNTKFWAVFAALLLLVIMAIIVGNATWTGAIIGLSVLAAVLGFIVGFAG